VGEDGLSDPPDPAGDRAPGADTAIGKSTIIREHIASTIRLVPELINAR
jgi:hypothetical protein